MTLVHLARRSMSILSCSVIVAACSSNDSASPQQAIATSLVATSTSTQSATVGAAVSSAPAVKAVSSAGAPVPGVSVVFTVTSGGGKLGTASTATATTGVDGIATAGTWTLGTTTGTNTITAASAGLSSVTFTASGVAGAAASLVASAGDNQSAAVGASVTTAPAVTVKDQYGNAVANAPVTFTVDAGGGSITGATTTTGADGVARVGGWTLGITTNAQRLKATSGTLSATLTATATVPAGCNVINYALGATLPLSWEANDCTNATYTNRLYDRLQFTTTSQQMVDATVDGPAGRWLLLRKGDLYVGLQPSTAFSPSAQNPMHLNYILAPGTYVFEPHAPSATATGSYQLSTSTLAKVACDYITFATTNVTFSGVVDNLSCLGPVNDREQWINLQLKTGMKVKITLSGTDEVPFLILRDDRLGPASPTLVTAKGTTKGETVSVTWTATFDQWHEIIITSTNANLLGKYTLKIEELP